MMNEIYTISKFYKLNKQIYIFDLGTIWQGKFNIFKIKHMLTERHS